MATNSSIEWTQATWNPVTGCTKASPGCRHCYAERMTRRLQAMGQRNYVNGFKPAVHEHALSLPLHWKKPRTVFVNSMSDLFHRDISGDFIQRVFNVMWQADWHVFQVLTKRSERLLAPSGHLPWPDNIWMGVSVENADYAYRIDHPRATSAATKFLSPGTAAWPAPRPEPGGDRLGYRRWRVRPGARSMDPLGYGHQGPMRPSGCSLLLQAVGRSTKEKGRAVCLRVGPGMICRWRLVWRS